MITSAPSLLPATRRHDLAAASGSLGVLPAHADTPVVTDTTVGAGARKGGGACGRMQGEARLDKCQQQHKDGIKINKTHTW